MQEIRNKKKEISNCDRFGLTSYFLHLTSGSRGFTLLELLLTMSIIGLMTGVILSSQAKFGGEIILRSLAYDVALSVRQAQTFGISVKNNPYATEYSFGHGIHVNLADPREYILFADTYELVGGSPVLADSNGGDGLYSDPREEVNVYTIGAGYTIKQVCVTDSLGESCFDAGSDTKLDILFKRPEPDAQIRLNGGNQLYTSARIVLLSPRQLERSVSIEVTGQVSIEKNR
jgi:prepilin-type N-terminal cleavage/methylation domain-containing protein